MFSHHCPTDPCNPNLPLPLTSHHSSSHVEERDTPQIYFFIYKKPSQRSYFQKNSGRPERSATTDQPGQVSLNRLARTGQPGQVSLDRSAWTVSLDWTDGTSRQQRQVNLDRETWTYQSRKVSREGRPGHVPRPFKLTSRQRNIQIV